MPGTYSVMDMGYLDHGGGPVAAGHDGMAGHGSSDGDVVDVTELVADPDRPADVRFTLTARKERFRLASGEEVDGYTVNGTSPGPTLRVTQGQLVEVTLANESVPDGVALHWHGIDVPNAADGVAGVTQDAVATGETHAYRFVADQVGTYWYHSHQVSHEQVRRGLLGAIVVHPADAPAPAAGAAGDPADVVAVMHVYRGITTVNGRSRGFTVDVPDGTTVRVRLVNTDNGATNVWTSGSPYRVLAVDGYDVNEPTLIDDRALRITAGARADLEVTAPARVELGAAAIEIGSEVQATPQPQRLLDLLHYGTASPLPFDIEDADRRFDYSIGRRPGFLDGRPGLWWSVNGHLFPDVPMYVVREGDVVRMRIENHSGEAHPMHLHGHHAVVLSRDGEPATGSPWWVDSLDVANGEEYEIAFLADNPGIWIDHCHNLPHAADGLVAHLMYEGVTTPYVVGGEAGNRPE